MLRCVTPCRYYADMPLRRQLRRHAAAADAAPLLMLRYAC